MTDVLLIQPPIRDFYLTAKRTIPYGLACIATALRQAGFRVQIIDALASPKRRILPLPAAMAYLRAHYGRVDRSPFALFHHFYHFGLGFDHIGRQARRSGAFLVGISSLFTPYADEALATAAAVKHHHPQCQIVMGGHHPSAFYHEVLAHPAVDYVIRGDGERALPALARALRENRPVGYAPGIVWKDLDGTIPSETTLAVMDAHEIPAPAMDLIQQHRYRRRHQAAMVVVTSRGCPLDCSYCSLGRSSGIPHRRRPVAGVLAEIAHGIEEHGVRFIDFEDENLSLDRAWFRELLAGITPFTGDRGVELRAMNGLLPATLDSDMVGAMRAAGFKTLNLSLGSSHPDQAARFQRPDLRASFERVLARGSQLEMNAVAYVIAGAPFQSALQSVDDLLYLARRPVLAGLSIYYPAPESRDFERCQALDLLPEAPALWRSTALPLDLTTTRLESVTLLRLARLLNFIKSILDAGRPLPEPAPVGGQLPMPDDRRRAGERLLAAFLHDGKIRGVEPDGVVYEHPVATDLTRRFLNGLNPAELCGTVRGGIIKSR